MTQGQSTPNVIVADFTQLDRPQSIDQLQAMTQVERDRIEQHVAADVADQLMQHLAWTDAGRKKLIDAGQQLARQMSWDQVIEQGLLPMLQRIGGSGGD